MQKIHFFKALDAIRKFFLKTIVILTSGLFLISISCTQEYFIENPYEKVDWESYGRYKGDLHVHTSRSDGHLAPQVVVDRFNAIGYSIVAITDHNLVTYPWQNFSGFDVNERVYTAWEKEMYYLTKEEIFNYENRDPASLGMIAIQGNEISHHHHLGSYFCDHKDPEYLLDEDGTMKAITAKKGLAVLNHPGDYDGSRASRPLYQLAWYVSMFRSYDNLVGMEAYNTGLMHQPGSIHKWDSTLIQLMPDRPVWGFSNEDYHGDFRPNGEVRHVMGRNGNLFLLPELSKKEVRSAMEKGQFLIFHNPKGTDEKSIPEINSINVNPNDGLIEINASNYKYIDWISNGEVIHKGDFIVISKFPDMGSYVRAVVYSEKDGAFTGTQPFGIRKMHDDK